MRLAPKCTNCLCNTIELSETWKQETKYFRIIKGTEKVENVSATHSQGSHWQGKKPRFYQLFGCPKSFRFFFLFISFLKNRGFWNSHPVLWLACFLKINCRLLASHLVQKSKTWIKKKIELDNTYQIILLYRSKFELGSSSLWSKYLSLISWSMRLKNSILGPP